MSASKYKDRWATEQEETELAELEDHKAGICPGAPTCGYCLDEWEEANREELEKQGYYDSKGRWTT